jgi:hypothetical protein
VVLHIITGKQFGRNLCLIVQSCPPYRNDVEQIIPATLPIKNLSYSDVFLGELKMMLSSERQLKLLAQNSNLADYDITIKEFAHQIPIEFSNKKPQATGVLTLLFSEYPNLNH